MFSRRLKNLLILIFCLASAILQAQKAEFTLPDGFEFICPIGKIRGHLQGVCAYKNNLYCVTNYELIKTDKKCNILKRIRLKKEPPRLIHGGDPCIVDGKIYVPYCAERFNKPAETEKSDNFVQVYDSNLNYIKTYHIPQVKYGAGTITYADGHFFVSGGKGFYQSGVDLFEYDKEFNLIKKHQLNIISRQGIQTLNYDGKDFWIGIYEKTSKTYKLSRDFKNITYYNFYSAMGLLILNDGKILISSRNQEKGLSAYVISPENFKLNPVYIYIDKDGSVIHNNKRYATYKDFSAKIRCRENDFFYFKCSPELDISKWIIIDRFSPISRLAEVAE